MEQPPEGVAPNAPRQCSKLAKAMHGKRHVTVAWQA